MDFTEINNFANMEPNDKFDWRVQARVFRKWDQVNRCNGVAFGLNLDEFGDRCHAWIASTALDNLKDHFSEGLVYQIENFFVLPYKAKHMNRPFRNKFHICFTYFTHVFEMDTNNHIPRHVFDPIRLTQIRRHLDQSVYLIDVARVPENVTPISHFVDKECQSKCLVRFRVKNRRYHVKVTVWDDFALAFVKEMQKSTQVPSVIMISSCKVRTYRGMPCVENCAPTRFYINPEDPCVKKIGDENSVVPTELC